MTVPTAGRGTRLSGRAVVRSLLGQAGLSVFQTVVFLLLARLLAPEAFGLVAAALVIVNLTGQLATAGLRNAVVLLPDLTERHVRVAVTLQQALALAAFGALAACSGSLAGLLRMPDLEPVLRIMALAYLVRAFTVGDGLLMRRLQVERLAGIELSTYALGHGLVAVPMALAGFGVRAVVAGHLAHACLRTAALLLAAHQPLRPALSWAHARELLGLGMGSALAQLADLVALEGDNLVVGRFLGPTALGLYERAYRLTIVPGSLLGHALWQVLFPALSGMREEREGQRRVFRAATALVAVVALPGTLLLIPLADDLVAVLLGPAWVEMTVVLQILLCTVYLRTNTYVTDSLIMASGLVYRHAGRRVVFAVLVLTGALLGQLWGIRGVAVGVVTALALTQVLMVDFCIRLAGLTWREYLGWLVPALVVSLFTAPGVLLVVVLLHQAAAPAPVTLLAAPVVATLGVAVLLAVARRVQPVRQQLRLLSELASDMSGTRLGDLAVRHLPGVDRTVAAAR